jgi:hypothetical protein
MSDYKIEISEAIERIDEDAKRLSRILAWMDQDGEAAEKYREEIAFRLQLMEWLTEAKYFERVQEHNAGSVTFNGKTYVALEATLKTEHAKTGECTFGGFYFMPDEYFLKVDEEEKER